MTETILLAFAWLCLVTGAGLAAYVISKEIVFYWKESRRTNVLTEREPKR